MQRLFKLHRNGSGFSLLEVLIAVVVLSVGLLALAALQGALTRSSGEAKVRGRVAAMLTAQMDWLRHNGYGNIAVGTNNFNGAGACNNDPTDIADLADCAREQANIAIGELNVQQVVTVWFGAATFAMSNAEQDASIPQFKRVVLTATWTDAAGATHTQSISSDVSSMSLTNNIVVPPDPLATPTGGPIVRTVSPATAGVIPIALSNESTSATTNPVPELVGQQNNQQIVGTRFSVLNYTSSFGSSVVIQKRFDNEVVKCRCQYGAGGINLPVIYRTAMWPAIWTGEGYEVHDGNGDAPGQTLASGPRAGVEQSALCQECCRDHHDTGTQGEVRFDPERASTAKYNADAQGALTLVTDTQAGEYVNSCRLIRVDGFWRTASDIFERNHSLLETQPVAGVEAKSGLPTSTAVTEYENFVRNYVRSNYGGAQPSYPAGTFGHNAGEINIPIVSNTDYRYLHVRGLYIDYLEEEALEKIADVLADNDPQGQCPNPTDVDECVLPFLPFTTVNLTEIADWSPNVDGIITVNQRNLLSTNQNQPSGGRTIGSGAGDANAIASLRRSSSGIAVSSVLTTLAGVDPQDMGVSEQNPNTPDLGQILTDEQPFQVGPGNGPAFEVRVTGGGGNPFVFFTLGTDTGIECLKPSGPLHRCVTSENTPLPLPGAITVSHYWVEDTTNVQYTGQPCSGNKTVTELYPTPTFYNYVALSAAIAGVPGTIAAPVNDARDSETTTIDFTSIAQGAIIDIVLVQEGDPIVATVASCTSNGNSQKFSTVTWNKPWTLP